MKTTTFDPPLTQDEAIELAYAWACQIADDVVDGNNLLEAIRDVLEPFAVPAGDLEVGAAQQGSLGTKKTFAECSQDKLGTVYCDKYIDGIRVLVLRGPCSLCAYLGIPEGHPLAGVSYHDIPLDVHGGLTFAAFGDGLRPKGHYWFGWDYGHSGDRAFYDIGRGWGTEEKGWTPDEVENEAEWVVCDMARLMKLVERYAPSAPLPADPNPRSAVASETSAEKPWSTS